MLSHIQVMDVRWLFLGATLNPLVFYMVPIYLYKVSINGPKSIERKICTWRVQQLLQTLGLHFKIIILKTCERTKKQTNEDDHNNLREE